MLYFIGGKSQVGKSEIAKKIGIQNDHISIVHTDMWRVWIPGHDPDELGWPRITQFINSNKNQLDMLVEGVAVTPERVKKLEDENTLRAAFVGYGNEEYVNAMLRYAEAHPNEYLYKEEARRKTAGEPSHRENFTEQVSGSEELRKQAEAMGYKYFGMTEPPSFEERIQPIIDYLLYGSYLNHKGFGMLQ